MIDNNYESMRQEQTVAHLELYIYIPIRAKTIEMHTSFFYDLLI